MYPIAFGAFLVVFGVIHFAPCLFANTYKTKLEDQWTGQLRRSGIVWSRLRNSIFCNKFFWNMTYSARVESLSRELKASVTVPRVQNMPFQTCCRLYFSTPTLLIKIILIQHFIFCHICPLLLCEIAVDKVVIRCRSE